MATKKEAAANEQEQAGKTAEEILAEAKAEAAAILDKAKADAAAELEAAKKTAAAELTAAEATKPTGPKMVKIRLFKDNDKYKDDVFVAVNGMSYQIKRGEDVEVPDYVAEVLEQSAKQDAATANLIDQESSRYEAEAKARNL